MAENGDSIAEIFLHNNGNVDRRSLFGYMDIWQYQIFLYTSRTRSVDTGHLGGTMVVLILDIVIIGALILDISNICDNRSVDSVDCG